MKTHEPLWWSITPCLSREAMYHVRKRNTRVNGKNITGKRVARLRTELGMTQTDLMDKRALLPMIATLSDNALRAVPDSLRQGAYALGATSFEVTTRVVVPALPNAY